MLLDAVLEAVMESWPLQLRLRTDHERLEVVLDENAIVERASRRVEPGTLRPGQRVRIELASTIGAGRTARRVTILD
ncbi:MAG: hypothetical protein NZ555_05680 [Geminicoccaceae bacterium]|nr:hypothetical protein [Geminicoccaceae bacterium]MCX8101799.1 hypothetical protein [Geminicoccaceae bacterium]MDW8369645.1 hypothetical protein [Geminicoccaceae bacterium]